jgi:hypothetical protein
MNASSQSQQQPGPVQAGPSQQHWIQQGQSQPQIFGNPQIVQGRPPNSSINVATTQDMWRVSQYIKQVKNDFTTRSERPFNTFFMPYVTIC